MPSEENSSTSTTSFQPQTVLPGDDVTALILPPFSTTTTTTTLNSTKFSATTLDVNVSGSGSGSGSPKLSHIKLGKGLFYQPSTQTIHVTMAGTLLQNNNSPSNQNNHNNKGSNSKTITYHIRANTKRYIPKLNDRIVGIIEERYGDCYKVNIFGAHSALLPQLAFENATKRNKPNLITGATVYCRVDKIFPHDNCMEPLLSCQVSSTNKHNDGGANRKDWMTDENTYGELKGGTHIPISLGLARQLLQPSCVVLQSLGKYLAFEIAIGVNGICWIHSPDVTTTVLICNAIQNSEVMTAEQVRGMVRDLVQRMNLGSSKS